MGSDVNHAGRQGTLDHRRAQCAIAEQAFDFQEFRYVLRLGPSARQRRNHPFVARRQGWVANHERTGEGRSGCPFAAGAFKLRQTWRDGNRRAIDKSIGIAERLKCRERYAPYRACRYNDEMFNACQR